MLERASWSSFWNCQQYCYLQTNCWQSFSGVAKGTTRQSQPVATKSSKWRDNQVTTIYRHSLWCVWLHGNNSRKISLRNITTNVLNWLKIPELFSKQKFNWSNWFPLGSRRQYPRWIRWLNLIDSISGFWSEKRSQRDWFGKVDWHLHQLVQVLTAKEFVQHWLFR